MTSLNPIEAHKAIQAILSQKDYQVYYKTNQNVWTQVWNKMKQAIQDFLQRLLPGIHINESTSQWVMYVVVGLILLFLIYLVFKLWSNFTKTGRFRYRAFSNQAELAQTVSSQLKAAQEFSDHDEFKLATRHTFLALILLLNETDRIQAKPWKTNYEYALELQSQNKADADQFTQFARFFDEIFYGNHAIEQDGYLHYHRGVTDWMSHLRVVDVEEGGGV